MDINTIPLAKDSNTKNLGKIIYRFLKNNYKFIIYLEGDIGVGKTTLARSIISCYGFKKIKSPTYSLLETYEGR